MPVGSWVGAALALPVPARRKQVETKRMLNQYYNCINIIMQAHGRHGHKVKGPGFPFSCSRRAASAPAHHGSALETSASAARTRMQTCTFIFENGDRPAAKVTCCSQVRPNVRGRGKSAAQRNSGVAFSTGVIGWPQVPRVRPQLGCMCVQTDKGFSWSFLGCWCTSASHLAPIISNGNLPEGKVGMASY